jgi:hypothetical protein
MIKVYIAGPYRGITPWCVEQNIRNAEVAAFDMMEYSAYTWDDHPKLVAVCPHSMYRYFNKTLTDEFWIEATSELLRCCDLMYVFGDYKNSAGTLHEMEVARQNNIPICFNIEQVWDRALDMHTADSKL